MELTRLAAKHMIRQSSGRIVNIGSIAGRLSFPGGGWYHASKHALEALSDVLRWELAPCGVQVSLVQPGMITSGFMDRVASGMPQGGPWARFNSAIAKVMGDSYSKGWLGNLAAPPLAVAKTVLGLITARRAKSRVRVGASAGMFLTLRALCTDRSWDRLLDSFYPRPVPADVRE
jgi:NAD(P)-dependent dehydrogenase (short-subunit alcohol dehydrogenase family)